MANKKQIPKFKLIVPKKRKQKPVVFSFYKEDFEKLNILKKKYKITKTEIVRLLIHQCK